MLSFLSEKEIESLGFKSHGKNLLISRFARFYSPDTISIGDNVRIDDFCLLTGNITIGSYIHISAFCALYGRLGIELKDFSGLSARCTVFSASDDFSGEYMVGPLIPVRYTNVTGGKVTIGTYVQLGAGTIVLPTVNVNEGSASGAMSLINKDVDEWKIVAGVPAKIIKNRSGKVKIKAERFSSENK